MIKPKKYNYSQIEYSYFDLDLCFQKDTIEELLKNSTPKKVVRFNSKGTYWDFCEYITTYHIVINGGNLILTTYMDSFETVCNFLYEVMSCDNKLLLCPFGNEDCYTLLLVTPLDNDLIRCTVFDEQEHYNYNYDSLFITADIIIKKQNFLKQWKSLIEKINISFKKDINNRIKKISDDSQEINSHEIKRLNGLKDYYDKGILEKFNQYFENPSKFKAIPRTNYWMRVYDIAFKDWEGWHFVLAFDQDKRGNIKFWEKLKSENKIFDYDYLEQDPIDKEILYLDNKTNSYYSHMKIKPDYEERKFNKNWCYSPDTEKWYSKDEIMDKPQTECTQIDTPEIKGGIDERWYSSQEETIKDFFAGELEALTCQIQFCLPNKIYEIKYDYCYKEEICQKLKLLQEGKDVRFFVDSSSRLSIWHEADKYIRVLYHSVTYHTKRDNTEFQIILKKDDFISGFFKQMDNITKMIADIKNKIQK